MGAEAAQGTHHNANNKNNQHFRWEIPCQTPDVNQGQEDWDREDIMDRYRRIYLQQEINDLWHLKLNFSRKINNFKLMYQRLGKKKKKKRKEKKEESNKKHELHKS